MTHQAKMGLKMKTAQESNMTLQKQMERQKGALTADNRDSLGKMKNTLVVAGMKQENQSCQNRLQPCDQPDDKFDSHAKTSKS